MADGKTFEYGSSASEVQFQDEIGKIKNRQGEAVIEVNDDQEFFLATSGDSVKIKTLIDNDAFDTGVTDTALATAESIKAYVDASSGGGGSGDITPDSVTVDTNTLVANITGYTDKVGVGTATPRSTLDILDASNPQLRVSQADNSVYADVEAKSTGGVHITPTGGTYAGHTFLKSGSASSYLVVQNSTTTLTDDRSTGLSMGVGGDIAYIWMRGTGPGDTNCSLNIGAGGTGGLTLDADNDIVALEGSFQLKAEIAAPSAPASGEGGIFYVKADGIPYYISNSTAETSLVGGGVGTVTEIATSGDLTGGPITGSGTIGLATTSVSAGSYTSADITVDSKGRITAAASGSSGGALTMTAVSFGVDGATYSAATYDTMYLVTTTGGAVEVNLPTAGSQPGKTIDILAVTGATNSVTVDPNGVETINGSGTSLTLSSNYQNVTLISDGTNWVIR